MLFRSVDARLEQAWRLIDQGAADEEWTAYVPSLERQLYRWRLGAEELCPPTNGVGQLGSVASSTEANLHMSVVDNGHR